LIETERLQLHSMDEAHLDGLVAMNADPEVMAHFPAALSPTESEAQLRRMQAHQKNNGFGYRALIRKSDSVFLGFAGLGYPGYETPFSPCVEIGWRLRRSAWGEGYAYEAAQACLDHGFGPLGLSEIVSFTTIGNTRSQNLMRRLGMISDPTENFEHPMLVIGHPLSWHVLYRLHRP